MSKKEDLEILLELKALQGAHNARLANLEKDLTNQREGHEKMVLELKNLITDVSLNLRGLENQAQKWKWGFAGILGFAAFGATAAKLWNDLFKHVIN